ncbi:NAD(P)-binding protein [Trematosphaeria pertusa]|uniref:NAD(P)-binding protein n=1 Tax=Trematosphaeria pertusa TaxID=390896 RepID=A0A6A6I8N3_9PLEO|nr:NAD(P)-binding protein [Trematosphaeria pertusa]KAF2246302.1 NAD(P)-binding protein [Trematosphaeria pertusa]
MAQQYACNQPSTFKNHIQNIAIVGAAGQVGKFISSALLEKNKFKITAITREGSTNTPVPGIHIAAVDYDKPDTLVEALKDHDVLIITMSVRAPPGQSAKLIEAAAKAGVPWVLPNEFGGDGTNEELGRDIVIGPGKKKDRDLIESLGVSSWIGIACGFWYEYSLAGPGLYGIDIAKREVVFFDDGKQRLNTSTWPQTGRAIAQLLSLPILPQDENDKNVTLSSYRNRFVFVSSFTLNQREMLDSVQRVTGTTNADWEISSVPAKQRFEEAQKRMATGDYRAFATVLYTRAFFPGDNAALFEVTHGLDNEKLGLPKEDLDEYTKESVKLAESGYFAKIFGSS